MPGADRGEDLDEDESTRDVTGVVSLPIDPGGDETAKIVRSTRLVCVVGASDLGRSFRLGSTPVVIGRASSDVKLQATDVSRSHAKLEPHGQDFLLEDLGSSNGTLVNGTRITRPTRLQLGDRIQLGTTILVLTLHDEFEDRMRQLQRVEAMTAFAGGLAHDFNNTLTVIRGNLSLLREGTAGNPQLNEIVADLEHATSDASGLVNRLLRLGRPDPITFERVRLHGIAQRVVAQFKRVASANIGVTMEIPETLLAHGSAGELHQMLLNLMINSRDAMPNGGAITISARNMRFERLEAAQHHIAEGMYVQLTVRDTGIGMDEATAARVFEPFFTTKSPGKGTGLGLAMIHQIVRSHGGSVSLSSRPGDGTDIVILLPAG